MLENATIIRVRHKNTVYVIDLWITDAVCDVKSWMHFAIENIAASSCNRGRDCNGHRDNRTWM